MPLSEVIENIQRGTWELVEDRRKHRADLEAAMLRFVELADAKDCLLALNALISRVSSITGDAYELEEAATMLTLHIESEDQEDSLPLLGLGEVQAEIVHSQLSYVENQDQ